MTLRLRLTCLALVSLAMMVMLNGARAQSLDFKKITLLNNWAPFGNGTRVPAVAIDANGIVHMKGAMFLPTGSNDTAFVLIQKFRPNGLVYVPVDMNNGKTGRLIIGGDGVVVVQAENDAADAHALTSLEGVSFSKF